jgi:hypothetical protein
MKQPKIDSFKPTRTRQPEEVSMPETARPIQRTNERSPKPNGTTERVNGATERVNGVTGDISVLQEIKQGVKGPNRPTERFSFQIFTEQKEAIQDLQYQYRKRTGKPLSTSRIIREAITAYLKQALGPSSG